MNKLQLITAILAANCGLVENDREALTALTDKQIESLANLVKEMPTVNFAVERKDGKVSFVVKNKTETTAPAPAAPAPAVVAPAPAAPALAPAVNAQAPKTVTVQEYISAAPREVQDVLANSMSVYNDEKRKLVDMILANKRNVFSKQDLESRPLGELKAMAQLAAPEEQPGNVVSLPNYSGQAPVPTGNTGGEEPLTSPAMNFEKKTAAN